MTFPSLAILNTSTPWHTDFSSSTQRFTLVTMLHLFHILLCGAADLGAILRLLTFEVILSGIYVISSSRDSILSAPRFDTLGNSSTASWSASEVLVVPQPASGLIDPSVEYIYPVLAPPAYSSALAVIATETDIHVLTHHLQLVIYAAVLAIISPLITMEPFSRYGVSLLRPLACFMPDLSATIVPFDPSPIWLLIPSAISHKMTIITTFWSGLSLFASLRAIPSHLVLELMWVICTSKLVYSPWLQMHTWLPEGCLLVV